MPIGARRSINATNDEYDNNMRWNLKESNEHIIFFIAYCMRN